MVVIRRKLNYRNILFDKDTQQQLVEVRRKSGEHQEVLWCGFITRREALGNQHSRPVKIKVHSFRIGLGNWTALRENEYLVGSLVVGNGVSAVLYEGEPRIVRIALEA